MSEKLPEQPQNEEVDLGQLFDSIGKMFERLFAFIKSIFIGLFKSVIYALKPIVNNFKLIAILLMIVCVLGFVADKFKETVYTSDMLVKPYFESKYQLANNVDYFNALIGSENLEELSAIFEIDSIASKTLLGFEIEIGPETQNDLLKEYDNYIKSIDSTLAEDVTYEDFIENRDILAGTVFSIKASSSSNDIFVSLEKGFIKTFENEYSKKLKRIRDSSLLIRKSAHLRELDRIDSLQRIYLEIKKNESNSGEITIGTGGMFPLTQEKSSTKEYELFQEELQIRDEIRVLEETLIEESDYYDILSGFEKVGSSVTVYKERFILIFPAIALIIMLLSYIMVSVFKFIKNYE